MRKACYIVACACLAIAASMYAADVNLLDGIIWTEYDAGNAFANNIEAVTVGSEVYFSRITTTSTTTVTPTTTSTAGTTTSITVTTTSTTIGNSYEIEYLFAATWSGVGTNESVNTGGGGFGTNGLTGAVPAQPTWVDTDGTTSAYTSYDNADYINTRYSPIWAASQDFSIACWLRVPSLNDDAVWGYNIDLSPFDIDMRLGTLSDGTLYFRVGGNGTTYQTASGGSISTGVWYHAALVYDGASTVYLDGIQVGRDSTPTLSGHISTNSLAHYAGAINYRGSGALYFLGDIDNFIEDESAWASNVVLGVYQAGTNDHPNP